jgi:Patatin-like phospholipase
VTNQSSEHAAHKHPVDPLTTEQVLIEEAHAIGTANGQPLPSRLREARGMHGSNEEKLGVTGDAGDAYKCRDAAAEQHNLYQALNDLDRAALCLSGGGIRSAAFSLGVIQALATHPRPSSPHAMFAAEAAPDGTAVEFRPQCGIENAPYNVVTKPDKSLLAQLPYLSTVSGGGYIGSWLSAWRSRVGLAAVWANLVGRPCGPDVEPHTMAWLRAYSNYLTPKLGALSGDTWAGVAIALRNLLLNWIVIIPAICVVILLLKMIATVSIGVAVLPPHEWAVMLLAVAGIVLLLAAFGFTNRNRPSLRGDDMRDKLGRPLGVDQTTFLRWDVLPATLGAGMLIQLGASNSGLWVADRVGNWNFLITMLAGAIVYALGWLVACPNRRDCKDFWVWTASGLIFGALIAVGVFVYHQAPYDDSLLFNDLLLPVMFGVPWVLLSQMTAEMIYVGLSSYQRHADRGGEASRWTATPSHAAHEVGTHDDSESDREWLGRAAGWYLCHGAGLVGADVPDLRRLTHGRRFRS